MTIRKPLVVINGDIRELSASDTLTVSSISSGTYPVIRPSLNLNFSNSQIVDSRITFTRSSIATRVSNKGLIESVGSDVPRIDYDPVTLECKGLLIEEARTNLLRYSEQFDNAAWIKPNAAISANLAAAPDGSTTADILRGTGSGSHYAYLGYTVSAGVAFTMSCYVKNFTLTGAAGVFLRDFNEAGIASFNLATGTVNTTSGIASEAAIVDVGNGWYRISAKFTPTTSGTHNVAPAHIATSSTTTGIYIWGAQLEVGSFPTSYIPTVASSVPRVADVAMMTDANFSSWYRQDEFSAVARFIGNAVGTHTVASWNNTTANEMIKLESVSGTLTLSVTAGGVAQASISLGSVATGTSYIVAAAWKLNDIAASVNGAAVVTNIVATLPTPTQLAIGSVAHIFGYPQRLTNAQLQALSTQ